MSTDHCSHESPEPHEEPPAKRHKANAEDGFSDEQMPNVNGDASANDDVDVFLPPDPDYDFVLVFTNPDGFKTLFAMVKNVLGDCVVEVVQNENFQGIMISTKDASGTCFVEGRLACRVQTHGTQVFAFRMASLIAVNSNIKGREEIRLSRPRGGDSLNIEATDPNDASVTKYFTLPCIDRPIEDETLDDLEFPFNVEIPLANLSDCINIAKNFKAESLQFRIYKPITEEPNKTESYFEITAVGEVNDSFSFVYHSSMEKKSDDGLIVLHSDAKNTSVNPKSFKALMSNLEEVYNHSFSLAYMINFVQAMKERHIRLRMNQETGVLLVHHSLGRNSRIVFVIGSKVDDSSA